MIGTLFRSEDVPVEDRFDLWRKRVGRTVAPADLTSDHAADHWAEQRLLQLGPVTVWPTSFLPSRFRRNAKMVRQSDPELYHLRLVLDGGLAVDHDGRYDTYGPGDLYLADSSRPGDVQSYSDGERRACRGVGVEVPKALMHVPPHRELSGRRLSGREGIGALLTGFLTGLDRQADTLRPSDAPRLGTVLLDLLHDPNLTPPVIASAHHISLSYLHRLFQEAARGETVAACIRRRRLEGARRDLADPALRTAPIHTIATRWGLPRASDFTRTFRAAYGVSPKEYRLQALAVRE
ncbi:helix-turn-helix domain-containing protein [Streptomyces sp. NPDC059866]|uniref:AraC-like ligand-binding domain-containing protein n=1 Tax=Streptomyces sp. NPDC059866 TaxID=3346978 RepID=UPI003652D62F